MADEVSRKRPGISAEALIGTGITVSALGVMFLALSLAQYLREVKEAFWICFGIGIALFLFGLIIAATARVAKN